MRFLLLIGILASIHLKAQQFVQPSQYTLNKFIYNPAAAGTDENNPLSLYVRQQWAGYKNAPTTQGLSFHSKLGSSLGLGMQLYNDANGAFKTTGFVGAGAYHLQLLEEMHLSFGLSFSFLQNSITTEEFIMIDQSDETLYGAAMSTLMPDAGFGAYLFDKNLFFGVSALNLLQSSYSIDANLLGTNKQVMHMFATGGYRIMLGGIKLEPSFLMKMTEGAPLQLDLSGKIIYRENVWAGLTLRNNDALIAKLGMQRDRFLIGYSHDFTSSDLKNYSSGTNELFLQFGFRRKEKGTTKFN